MELILSPVPNATQAFGVTAAIAAGAAPEMTATPPDPVLATVPEKVGTAAVAKSYSRVIATQPPGGRRASASPARWASASMSWAVPSGLPTMPSGGATGISAATS